ncbi:hypothetical protein Mia14_0284 [Candidatus Mancarchaeum acidiphilum]|uniref:Uncharacterized protein n=1 Tax=Candidatus Mancarchaeum acidiphilum TaxID=1920749 RepID=A0A218NMC5_9ARCH|nr:hypothetical protein [Candidatus Mancarchaeum acidiphilum]ASI13614.1 hypothetical protein Mia14_0284 [Candidatus Mancarchaeum acidiphilum]
MVTNSKEGSIRLENNSAEKLFLSKKSMNVDKFINWAVLENEAIHKSIRKIEYETDIEGNLDAKKDVSAKLRLTSFMDKLNKKENSISLYNMIRSDSNSTKTENFDFDISRINDIEDKILSDKKLSEEEKKMLDDYAGYSGIFSYGIKKIGKSSYLVIENSINSLEFIKLDQEENVEFVENSEFFGGGISPINEIQLSFSVNDGSLSGKYNYLVDIDIFHNDISDVDMRFDKSIYEDGIKKGFDYDYRYYKRGKTSQIELLGSKRLIDPTNDEIYNALVYAIQQENLVK